MKQFNFLIFLTYASLVCGESESSNYVIVAPKYLHSARDYDLSIDLEHVKGPIKLHASIFGNTFNATKMIEVSENGLSKLSFDLPELSEGDYELNVLAEGALNFTEKRKLQFAKFKPVVAIQTQPDVYFDELEVLTYKYVFLVYILNENLHPFKEVPKSAQIFIHDAGNNFKRNFQNLKLKNGRFVGEFELLRNVNYNWGEWRLEVVFDCEVVAERRFHIWRNKKERNSEKISIKGQHKYPMYLNEKGALLKFENGLKINNEDFKNGQRLNVKENLHIIINSEVPHSYLVYTVIGRGKILQHDRIDFKKEQLTSIIELKILHAMAPYSRLIVYFVANDGKIHYAETYINVEPAFENKLHCDVKHSSIGPFFLESKTVTKAIDSVVATVLTGSIARDLEPKGFEIDMNELLNRLGGFNDETDNEAHLAVITISNVKGFLENNQITPEPKTFVVPKSQSTQSTKTHENIVWSQTTEADSSLGGYSAIFFYPKQVNYVAAVCLAVSNEEGFGYERTELENEPNNLVVDFLSVQPVYLTVGEIVRIRLSVKNTGEFEQQVRAAINQTADFELANNVLSSAKKKKKIPSQETVEFDFYIKFLDINTIPIDFEIYGTEMQSLRIYFVVNDKQDLEVTHRFQLLNGAQSATLKIDRPKNMLAETEKFIGTFYGGILTPFAENFQTKISTKRKTIIRSTSRSLSTEQAAAKFEIWTAISNYADQMEVNFGYMMPDLVFREDYPLEMLLSNCNPENGAFRYFLTADDFTRTSIWLTAYVLSTMPLAQSKLHKMETFNIDYVIEKSLKFLLEAQQRDGSFFGEQPHINERYQNAYATTAQVLLAFVENENHTIVERRFIEKTAVYLMNNFASEQQIFGKLLALNALHRADYREFAATEFEVLKLSKVIKSGEYMWCINNDREADAELTALMLLNLLELNGEKMNFKEDAVPLIKWLTEVGGVYQKVDVFPIRAQVIAAKAFIKYELLTKDRRSYVGVDIKAYSGDKRTNLFELHTSFTNEIKEYELNSKTTSIEFYVPNNTPRSPLVTLTVFRLESKWELETAVQPHWPAFYISATVDAKAEETTTINDFNLNICATFMGAVDNSNLSIISIMLPSGFVANSEHLRKITNNQTIQAIYTEEQGSLLKVFVSSMPLEQEFCFTIKVERAFPVSLREKSLIEIYEYDDYEKRAKTFYHVPNQPCDVCDAGENCLWPTYTCVS